jgi:hypothetical protein
MQLNNCLIEGDEYKSNQKGKKKEKEEIRQKTKKKIEVKGTYPQSERDNTVTSAVKIKC